MRYGKAARTCFATAYMNVWNIQVHVIILLIGNSPVVDLSWQIGHQLDFEDTSDDEKVQTKNE